MQRYNHDKRALGTSSCSLGHTRGCLDFAVASFVERLIIGAPILTVRNRYRPFILLYDARTGWWASKV